ncbi:LuxR C-terminal-related transcriptional regulator [Kitasatospora sp. NBC_00240]|uniref:helix-turn-helix transcriptional regulator n=1 Tax=Kitasatospora sp. NBC_00240 TaxID=2903567 RepID=UPI002252E578|nr:LuxR C-terminal-related transcriptional regulator [Kitasatospora sp. NBC_00240]MCX5213543.1 LuxR C-terminal-related transcriptional regulator [Kitasatospora sp. NBC_00240]
MTVLQADGAVRSGVRPGVRAGVRIPVVVHAADPISRAGALSQLKQCAALELVEEQQATTGAVAVMLAETVDATVTAALRRMVRGGEVRVVLVVERMREAELLEAVECGVAAILWRREATAPRLGQAVLAAARGDGDLPADLLGRLIVQMGRLQRSVQGLPGFTPPGISERESDILRLVAEGWDTAEIAAKLSYSERTVKNVLHGLTTRLHLRNRAHAVAYALREGYI